MERRGESTEGAERGRKGGVRGTSGAEQKKTKRKKEKKEKKEKDMTSDGTISLPLFPSCHAAALPACGRARADVFSRKS